ncbi:MAG: hypothetical protein B7X58_14315 [Marinobacter sp. 34-60-7]|nr:MAG: hypothetical protein B7X58_14315 [Marinobacter sp. 34-60-7]
MPCNAITAATLRLRRLGFLPTRGHTLETLQSIDTVVFDKTGTLTRGELSLTDVHTCGPLDEDTCLQLAAGLEKHSEHPIARVFHDRKAAVVSDVSNHLGGGLSGRYQGDSVFIGHRAFVESHTRATAPATNAHAGMEIWLATDTAWLARFELDDQIRDDARSAVAALHEAGIHTMLLSGDRSRHVQQVAEALGIEHAVGEASPERKLEELEALKSAGRQVMMVGDGLNDLPSMAGAGLSVAMGTAADLTQLKADAVLLNGQLMQLMEALKTSASTRRIIRQNMVWAFGYNLLALPVAAAGLVPPWLAAIGMSLSSLVVVLNALRLSRTSGSHSQPLPGG